jgi:predicted acylesterase/phospholipase RssA
VPNTKYWDLVMKGGITSGVIYPLAISELSTEYMFKNIGGTSAGAIAAAITAAAEYGRRSRDEKAFGAVAGIPSQLGANGLLLKLFQASPATIGERIPGT